MGTPHYHPCDLDCPNGLTAGALAGISGEGHDVCGHCGATDVGSPAAGYARGAVATADGTVVGAVLCHPNAHGRPDCYRLVTVYKHPMPCAPCTAGSVAQDPEIRQIVFAELRAALDQLKGTRTYRPYVGDRYLVHSRQQIEAWLDEQEQGLNKKGQIDG